jgi:hypothetical protein
MNTISHELLPNNVFKSTEITPDNLNINSDDIIIAISSIIHVSEIPILGHQPNTLVSRSMVSAQDRFNQTIEQLKSIKEKIPNAISIILEESVSLSQDEINELSKYSTYVILYGQDVNAYDYCHTIVNNKGLGEMYVISHLGLLLRDKTFKIFCKFNGRSIFLPEFDINNFIKDYPVVAALAGNGRLKILAYSNFYSIPKKFMNSFTEHILSWLDKNTTEPIEHILTMFVESIKHVYLVEKLHIMSISAITNISYVI